MGKYIKKIPLNTKLLETISDNFEFIKEKLYYLRTYIQDKYEFISDDEKNSLIKKFVNELNDELDNNYLIDKNTYPKIFIKTNNQKYNTQLIKKIGEKIFTNFEYKLKTFKSKKLVEINFQTNFLISKGATERIPPENQKFCLINFEIYFEQELYMIRFPALVSNYMKIFYDIKNINGRNKYVPNEFSKKINLVQSGMFGSSCEGFVVDDKTLKLVILELTNNGYEIGFTNIVEKYI